MELMTGMKTDDLIQHLGREGAAVTPLPAPSVRTSMWLIGAGAYLAAMTLFVWMVMSADTPRRSSLRVRARWSQRSLQIPITRQHGTRTSKRSSGSPRPLAVGSRTAFVAQFLGRRLEYTYEVVEWVPNERFVMRTADGPFAMETTCEWEDADGGATRMTLRNRGTPTGFSRWLTPVMGMAVRRANRMDLAALKAVLESSTR